jgi:hypothetical protein
LEKGTIAVNRETEVVVLTAPCEFDAKAGEQRAGHVFEDEVVWVDIYANPDDCQDLSVIEDRLYVVPECGLGDARKRLALTDKTEGEVLWLDGQQQQLVAPL